MNSSSGTSVNFPFAQRDRMSLPSEMEFSNRMLSTRYRRSCNSIITTRFWLQDDKRQIPERETFVSCTICTNSTITHHKFILMQVKLKRFVNRLLSAQKGSSMLARHFCQQNINLYASNFLRAVTGQKARKESLKISNCVREVSIKSSCLSSRGLFNKIVVSQVPKSK